MTLDENGTAVSTDKRWYDLRIPLITISHSMHRTGHLEIKQKKKRRRRSLKRRSLRKSLKKTLLLRKVAQLLSLK
jgi:hypothetical protein